MHNEKKWYSKNEKTNKNCVSNKKHIKEYYYKENFTVGIKNYYLNIFI